MRRYEGIWGRAVESQGQWSNLAITRTTPVLVGLFTIVTLWADQLQQQQGIKVQCNAWYQNRHPAFSDAMVQVREQLWGKQQFLTSRVKAEVDI